MSSVPAHAAARFPDTRSVGVRGVSAPAPPQLHSLQYLRAAAALFVVYTHAVIQTPDVSIHLPKRGDFGVDLFFVISGFVMVYITRPEDRPGGFVRRRLRRVVPLYWGFTLLLVAMLLLAPDLFRTIELSAEAVIKSLLFVPYRAEFGGEALQPLLIPGWTLNYEIYFYLLFGASLHLAPRYRVTAVALALATVFVACRAVGASGPLAEFYGAGIVFEFVLGMGLAVAWSAGLRMARPAAAIVAVAALLVLAVPEGPTMPALTARLFHFGLPSALLVAAVLCLEPGRWRFGILLGDASYALYLSHLFTLGALRAILGPSLDDKGLAGALAFVAVALVVCSAVGVAVHLLVERPLLARRSRRASGAQW